MFNKSSTTMPAKIIDTFPHKVREVEHAWIPLADGTRLAARYWMPEDAEQNPVPAILEYIPYCKRDGTADRDEAMHPYFAGHGYAAVRVDMRGSGESDGILEDEYLKQEQDDAIEVIAWLAEQPWCNGRVGMMGKSWGGFNGLQVAARQPPALQCIITVYSTDDRYSDDIHYMGGCLLAEQPMWAYTMFWHNARPADPALVGDSWRQQWLERLAANRPWIIDWMKHQRRDAFWQHGSVCEDYGAIRCPVYAIGGWADAYSNTVARLLAGLNVATKGLIGPWGHQYPHQAFPEPAIGFMQEALRWWDRWLKDIDNGIMEEPCYRVWQHASTPPKACYELRPGHWIAEPEWPSAHIKPQRLALNSDGLAATAAAEQAIEFACPQDVGLCSTTWCDNGTGGSESPRDQRIDDARSLCFDSAPLDEALALLGAPIVRLDLSSDQAQAFVCVRLCEVLADGASALISYGLLNLTHRDSHEDIAPLEPGKRYSVAVQLNDIAHEFAVGSRIRVAISTAFWPLIWPSPAPVNLTVYTGLSTLELPVRAARPEDKMLASLSPPEQSRLQQRTVVRTPDPSVMRFEYDIAANRVSYVQSADDGKLRFHHGWEFGGTTHCRQSIQPDDPLSACIELEGRYEYGRGDLQMRIQTTTVMTSDKECFHIKASLDAFENDEPVFGRSWLEHIPRDGV